MTTPEPSDIWQVRIETSTGGTYIMTFDNEEEATEFAFDYYTPMDTQEARDTLVHVQRRNG